MKIALSRMHFPVTSLGPGNRVGVWFQGCSIKCIGCVSKDTWPAGVNEVDMKELEAVLCNWLPRADGITISGGEPFDQFKQLERLLNFLKQHSQNSILVYSGYSYKEIENKVRRLDGLIDALISEPFEYKNNQTLPLRGSDNQILHLLTSLGESDFSSFHNKSLKTNKLDGMFQGDTLWLAGIGERDLLHRLSSELNTNGHEVKHTQTALPEPE